MKKIIYIIFSSLLLMSCEDFLDINTDPNNPSQPSINQLLPGIAYDVADDFSMAYSRLGYACAVFTHQLSSREPEYDKYGISGSAYAITTYWKDLYAGPVEDINLLIRMGEDETKENAIYAGIGKILKAYVFSQIVDLWGDVPYTEANVPGNLSPVFDNDQDIYVSLLSLLNEGISDLENTEAKNINTPGSDDLFYGGDTEKWIRAAKTIKLKLYNQVRLVDAVYNQADVNALLAGDQLINSGDDFLVPFGTSISPDCRHPAFVSEYVGAQISNYISPWFYEIMTGQNANIFNGIADPRVPYYWVNQLSGGEAAENAPEYRDGDFNSIYFASNGPNRDHAGRASFTMMGIYACGGKFDDGTGGGPLQGDAGTGAAPQRLITYADRLYIEAELIHVGKISGDERATLESAVRASFDQVDMVVDMVGPVQDVPSVYSTDYADAEEYIANVLSEYDAAGVDKKLEIIMTQKWISSWGSPVDQYTDYRRTGYPVLFDAASNGGMQSGGPDGSGPVPTNCSRSYPLSFPYDADEITLNTNSPLQKVISQSRIFWDIN